MQNFTYHAPTKVFFGRGTHLQVGDILRGYGFDKVLIHYGGGSVRQTGLYGQITAALDAAGVRYAALGGVQPNPIMGLVREGIALARAEGAQLILAVGGGSAIDSAKAIAVGARNDKDPALFYAKKAEPVAALPVGVILTLAASGSEMSASSVLTNEETGFKRGFNSEFHRPLFSILNPELTYTVNSYQTACGVVDIMMHTLERYLTQKDAFELTDRIAEGLLKTTIAAGRAAMANPRDYEARANLMWAGSLSHNDLTGAGRDYFMVSHQIEHEISGMFTQVAHGAGLAVVFPAWAKYAFRYNIPRFCQYAVRVWNCEMDYDCPENTALAGIRATEDFFAALDMPIRLRELDIGPESLEEMAHKCTNLGARVLPGYVEYGKQEIWDILKLAL